MKSAHFYYNTPVFYGKHVPEEGSIVGYAAIIHGLALQVPLATPIALVCNKNKRYENDEWKVFPKSYLPEDSHQLREITALYNHLVFALKYEGINLSVFAALIKKYQQRQLTELVNIEPTGQYTRKIWFLIEWLSGKTLPSKENLTKSKKSYVPLVNEKLQYATAGVKSVRHLIINNLTGTPEFCPLIRKTPKLEKYIAADVANQKSNYLKTVHKDTLQRASAFLLLRDSKASFTIEGESPKSKRAIRWGQAIGQAGTNELSREELLRLQQLVIENTRFVDMGFRKKGGFVGEHDRTTGEPLPDHISARWQDIDSLITGLLETNKRLTESEFDAVLAATLIAFGFVFIHPFEDGNGRIHRYLIHHVLAKKQFAQQGIIFPVSASILNHITDYRTVLESYSRPLLDFIEWKETDDHNVEVTNNTIDYYRYFDATRQAEFVYDCVQDTIEHIIPEEINYLNRYDTFKHYLEEEFDMPDKLISMALRFLEHNNGKLSKRSREKELKEMKDAEVEAMVKKYKEVFLEE